MKGLKIIVPVLLVLLLIPIFTTSAGYSKSTGVSKITSSVRTSIYVPTLAPTPIPAKKPAATPAAIAPSASPYIASAAGTALFPTQSPITALAAASTPIPTLDVSITPVPTTDASELGPLFVNPAPILSPTVTTTTTSTTTATGFGSQAVLNGSVLLKTQFFDALDYRAAIDDNVRGTAVSSQNLFGDGVTGGGYSLFGTAYPDIAFKGSVKSVGGVLTDEEEFYYLAGKTYYDTAIKRMAADKLLVGYKTVFTPGLPSAVSDKPSGLVENRNAYVRFLGRQYLVERFSPSSPASVSLAPIVLRKKLSVNESLEFFGKKLLFTGAFKSWSDPKNASTLRFYANFDLLDSAGKKIDSFSLSRFEGQNYYSKNGADFKLYLLAAANASLSSSYVLVTAYSQRLVLTDGQKIGFVGDDARTKTNGDAGWAVKLETTPITLNSTAAVSLKSIQLIGQSSGRLRAGESLNILASPASKKLTFVGLEQTNMDALRIEPLPGSYSITGEGYSIDKNFTRLKSSFAYAFDTGKYYVDSLYFDKYNGGVYAKDLSSANYTRLDSNFVTYTYPNAQLARAIELVYSNENGVRDARLRIFERSTVFNNTLNGWWEVDLYPADASYLFDSSSTSTTLLTVPYYSIAQGIGNYAGNFNKSVESGFISPGGSELKEVTPTSVAISYSPFVRKALYSFSPAGARISFDNFVEYAPPALTNTPPVTSCTDSDERLVWNGVLFDYVLSGLSFTQKGSAAYLFENKTDYCQDNNTLVEFYCSSNRNSINQYAVNCSSLNSTCVDGACVEKPKAVCSETDGGYDSTVKGNVTLNGEVKTDFCADSNTVAEYSCSYYNDSYYLTAMDCSYNGGSCVDGACVEKPKAVCSETDGGYDVSVKGDLTYKGGNFTDFCIDSKNVFEYACSSYGDYYSSISDCSYQGGSCIEGACVVPKSCTDSDNGENAFAAGVTGQKVGLDFVSFKTDSCLNETFLAEYSCSADNTTVQTSIDCAGLGGACYNGLCVKASCDLSAKNGLCPIGCTALTDADCTQKCRINYGSFTQSFDNGASNPFNPYNEACDASKNTTGWSAKTLTEPAKSGSCTEVVAGHNNAGADRLNIVFMFLGYKNQDIKREAWQFVDYDGLGNYDIALSNKTTGSWPVTNYSYTNYDTGEKMEYFDKVCQSADYKPDTGAYETIPQYGLLSIEPYKSNKDKINFWFKRDDSFDPNTVDCYEYIQSIKSVGNPFTCQLPNEKVVYLCNQQFRSFAWFSGDALISAPMSSVFVSWQNKTKLDSRSCKDFVGVHELGHSFGLLADEYVEWGSEGYDTFPNCAVKLDTAKTWWSSLEGQGYP
ncbi:hypothetical protein HY993_03975, partial [Candidatus Micrarchaeota archaeon]|nr:hypothetical protein [Candidatus Micrarchaeota archaeon]